MPGIKPTYEELEANIAELQHRLGEAEELLAEARRPAEGALSPDELAEAVRSKGILDAIMSHIPEGVTVADRQNQLVIMESRYGLDLTGKSHRARPVSLREGLARMRMRRPEQPQPAPVEELPLWRATMKGETVKEEEWLLPGPHDEPVSLMINAGPIRDAFGNITGGIAAWRDITKRKQLENELRRSEEQFRRIFNINPGPIAVICADSRRFVEVNRAFVESMGYSHEEAVGMDTAKVWHDLQQREEVHELVRRHGECHDMEAEFITKSGEVRRLVVNARLIDYDSGPAFLVVTYDITDRKRTEEALRQNEQLLTKVLDTLPVGVAIVDKESGMTRENPSFERIWGGHKENIDQYMGWRTATGEPIKPAEWNVVKAVTRGETNLNEQIIIEGFDGKRKHVLCSGIPLHGSDGEITGAIAVMEDITARYEAEAALRQSEETYRAVVQTAGALIMRTDLQGRITFINEYAKKFFHRGDDAIGMYAAALFKLKDEADRELLVAQLTDVLAQQSVVPYLETESYDDHGEPIWVAWNVRPVTDINGHVVEMQGIGIDITQRKRADEALRQSEQRFRTLIEALPNTVWTVKPDGTFEYVNRRWTEYTGMPADQADQWMEIIHPEDREETLEHVQHTNQTGEVYQVEHRVRRYDGVYRWHLSRAVPLRDEKNDGFHWFGTSTDIHDQKMIEHDLRRLAEELERSNKELEEFAYVASHDLQEPLRMITGYLQLIERRYKGRLDADGDEFIAYAVDGASRMQRLIADLLAYSRVGTRGRAPAPTDLGKAFQRAQADLWSTIVETGARITHDPLPYVNGDETQLAQLFLNLLGNAIKFRSEKPPEIHVGVQSEDETWIISVTDNGIGLDPRYASRIFQVFQRLHTRLKYPGTGIGLAICKKIVDRHGGRIWVESNPGEGSTFYFTLPKTGGTSWT